MDRKKKAARYLRVYQQIQNLILQTSDPISKMSTIIAILHHKFDYYFWTGFYHLNDAKLTVGCYQGSLACLVLESKGVCWKAINTQETVIVPDVHKFPGHIACDSRSRSEIVVPVFKGKNVLAVFDVDSKELDIFDDIDANWLEKIVELIY